MKTRNKMRNLTLVCSVLMLFVSLIAKAQDEGELVVPISEPGKRAVIDIDIKKGSIEVRGTSRKDVKVLYKTRKKDKEKDNKSKDGLRKIASGGLDLEAYERNNRVSVNSDSWNTAVDLIIEIPANSDLKVATYNSGDIYVDNVTGEVVAENYNGKIKLMNIAGSAVAGTYNGEIKVTLTKVTPDTPMSFTTYNGDVDITFPTGTKGNLKLKTSRGDIYSGFDMVVSKSEPIEKKDDSKGIYRVYIDEWTRATINGGGPDITMKNYNGDIYIRNQ